MVIAIFASNWEQGLLLQTGRPILDSRKNTMGNNAPSLFYIPNVYSLSIKYIFAHANWGEFVFSQIWSIIFGILIGFTLTSILKSSILIQGIGTTMMMFALFLAPQTLDITLTRLIDATWVIGYMFTPFRLTFTMLAENFLGTVNLNALKVVQDADHAAWTSYISSNSNWIGDAPKLVEVTSGSNAILDAANYNLEYLSSSIFDFENNFYAIKESAEGLRKVQITYLSDKILNLVLPFIWVSFFVVIIKFKFRWRVR